MRNILALLLILECSFAWGQIRTNTDSLTTLPVDIREKLVQLALQNPDLEAVDHQVKEARYEVKLAKTSWLNNIHLSGNVNEFTIKSRTGAVNTANGRYYPFYPIYNVGVTLPLGSFFSQAYETKMAKERLAAQQAGRSSKVRGIRTAVLSKYEDYLTLKQLLTVQSQITESKYLDYLQAKEKFRNGEVSVDDYNEAEQQYYSQVTQKLNTNHDFKIALIELEQMIGVSLDSVMTTNGVSANETSP